MLATNEDLAATGRVMRYDERGIETAYRPPQVVLLGINQLVLSQRGLCSEWSRSKDSPDGLEQLRCIPWRDH
jgi:hypothetical protein